MGFQVQDNIYTQDWGVTGYKDALGRQQRLVDERIENMVEDQLILTEHPPTYTLGQRKEAINHLVWTEVERQKAGIECVHTNRGGDVTYHGPGQIVGYPIVCLQQKKDLHAYLRSLEQVIINTLGYFGLVGHRREGKTGIWLEKRKIAAIGIAVKRWVTYHGFALNVNNDLTPFSGIIPCGIQAQEGSVTSLSLELEHNVSIEEVKNVITVEFWKIFDHSH